MEFIREDIFKMLQTSAPKPEYIFEDLVQRGMLVGIYGKGGVGKSFLIQQLIVSTALGRPLVSSFRPVGRSTILWLQGEDPVQEIHRRLEKIFNHFHLSDNEKALCARNIHLYPLTYCPLTNKNEGRIGDSENFEKIKEIVKHIKPDIIVLDPQSSFFTGDENSNPEAAFFMAKLRELARLTERGAAIFCLHHVSKIGEDNRGSSAGRGASAFRDGARATFNITGLNDKEWKAIPNRKSINHYIRISHSKVNYSTLLDDIVLERELAPETGGVLVEIDFASMLQSNHQSKMLSLAEALSEAVGENPNNYSIYQLTKSKNEATKITRPIKVAFNVYWPIIKDALNLALDEGMLVVDMVKAGNSKRLKGVPRKAAK